MITIVEANILNALDDAACVFQQMPLRSDGLRDYQYVFVNAAFRQLFGTPDLAGFSVRNNFPNEPESWYDDYDEVLHTGIPKRFIRKAPSQNMTLEMYVTRIEDISGRYLLNTMRNITMENQVEEALHESEAKLKESEANIRNLIKQAPVAMSLLKGPNFVIEIVNDSFIELWGKDSNVRGKPILEALPEIQGQAYPEILKHVYETGETYYGNEARVFLFREGRLEPGYFNFVNEPYYDSEGKISGVIVVANEVTNQVIANQALQNALEKIGLAKEAAKLGMFDYDVVNDSLEWDNRCRELFGVSQDAPVDFEKDFFGGLHPDDRKRLEAAIKDSFIKAKTDGVYDTEYRTVGRNDGLERWVRAKGKVFFDEIDRPIRFIGSVLDITETKKHQEEQQTVINQLRLSEERFRNLVENAPVGIAIYVGRELIVGTVNEAMLAIWGKDKSVTGWPLSRALPELVSENQPYLQLIDEVFVTGKRYDGEEEKALLLHNGELKAGYFTYIFQPLFDAEGHIYAVMQVAINVTAQVEARLATEQADKRFKLIADNISQLVWMADAKGDIFWYNQRWYDYTGSNLEEMYGWGWQKVHHPDHVKRVADKLCQHYKTGEPWEDTFPLRRYDGEYRWFLSRAVPSRDSTGKIVAWFGTNTDITDQRKLDEQKDDFIGIASHELKTPLTSLRANLQLLERMKNDLTTPMAPKLIDTANKSMTKINALIDDLLNVNQFTKGKIELKKKWFNLWHMLTLCGNEVNAEQKFKLKITGDSNIEIYADEHRIEQVVVNFVNNAIKYAPLSKTIFLDFFKQDTSVKISVRDNGPGIPQKQLPHLFDRYWRADHAGRQYTGLGLGLFICAEIVNRHGGEIGADSVVGEGSTFWFTIPQISPNN